MVLFFVLQSNNCYNILFIGIERFIYILKPLRYASIVTEFRTSVAILALWAAIFAHISILLIFGTSFNASTPCKFFEVLGIVCSSIVVSQFFLIAIVLIPCHTKILQTVVKLRKTEPHVSNFTPERQPQQIEKMRQRKMARTMTLVLVIFLFCYLLGISYNMIVAKLYKPPQPLIILLFKRISKMILWVQSLINPGIYGWKNKAFRRAYKKLLGIKPNDVHPQ